MEWRLEKGKQKISRISVQYLHTLLCHSPKKIEAQVVPREGYDAAAAAVTGWGLDSQSSQTSREDNDEFGQNKKRTRRSRRR